MISICLFLLKMWNFPFLCDPVLILKVFIGCLGFLEDTFKR